MTRACRSRMSPRRWGSHASAPIAGWPASTPRATPGCDDRSARGRIDADANQSRGRSRSWSPPGSSIAVVRTGSAPSSASRPAPSAGSCAATTCLGCASVRPDDRRGDPRHRRPPPSATNVTGPASWSTWTSRRSAGSPTAAAGEPTAARWAPAAAQEATTDRLRLRPLRRRRPQPPRLLRDPRRRDEPPPAPRSSPAPPSYFAAHGIARIERGHDRQRLELHAHGRAFAELLADLGAKHKFIKPHCPWQNGKVERFNRTLQTEWAYRQVFTTNDERTAALAPWLEHYNTRRRHSALGGLPPISRLSPT